MKKLYVDNYVVSKPIYDIIVSIKRDILNGKLNQVQLKGDWVRVTCPSHADGKESHASCGVYIGEGEFDYGYYHCFTCNSSGNFIRFISECMDCSESYAKKWLISNYGEKINEQTLNLEPIVLNENTAKDTELDESILKSYQSWHPYMEKRKLSKKVCEEFKVKYDPKSECLVFPVYDEHGKLTMMTRRSVKNKTFIIDKDKEKPVYLMHYIRKNGIKEVTVCESQINALNLWCYGIPSVATFGCNITKKQIEIFNKSGLNHIYICYDGDEAGIKGTKKFIERINKNILVDVIVMDPGKDVNDISEERFNHLPILTSDEWMVKYGKK